MNLLLFLVLFSAFAVFVNGFGFKSTGVRVRNSRLVGVRDFSRFSLPTGPDLQLYNDIQAIQTSQIGIPYVTSPQVFEPELPLPQAVSFTFIVLLFAGLRVRVLGIEKAKDEYNEKYEKLKEKRLQLFSDPSMESSDEMRMLEREVEESRMAWESAREIAPGIRVVTAEAPMQIKEEGDSVAVSVSPGGTDGRVSNPYALVLLAGVALLLTSTLFLLGGDPMKGGGNWGGI
mmetsp:Transcript_6996/g.14107  ORF Transcript_6996/g.14107 Transcript_6996/m.14107 type:complete len:231 (-) Transcript_6996:25-717(-)